MCKENSLEPFPPTVTGCTLPGWAGTGGWVSCPEFNLRVCEGHAFLSHSFHLFSWMAGLLAQGSVQASEVQS